MLSQEFLKSFANIFSNATEDPWKIIGENDLFVKFKSKSVAKTAEIPWIIFLDLNCET